MGIDGEIQPVDGYAGDVGYPDMSPSRSRRPAGRVGNPTPMSPWRSLTFSDISRSRSCPRTR